MEWKEIKERAWEMSKTNKWNVWIPSLILMVIEFIIGAVLGTADANQVSSLINILLIPVSFGIADYYLRLVRGEELDVKVMFAHYDEFLKFLVLEIIVGLMIIGGCILFIIPGIIIALTYQFMTFVAIDNPEMNQREIRIATKELMMGHRFDYFLFMLSFFGWILLCFVTLGIAAIWVVPYITIAEVLYYESLRGASKSEIEAEVVETTEE